MKFQNNTNIHEDLDISIIQLLFLFLITIWIIKLFCYCCTKYRTKDYVIITNYIPDSNETNYGTFPTSNLDDNCCICQDKLRNFNTVKLSCDHIYHIQCANNWLKEEAQWFKPNLGDVKYLFEDTFKNYKDWVTKAKRQTKISKAKFSYKSMSNQINEIFDISLPILPKKMELKLPGMDKIKMPKKSKLKKV